MSEPSGISRADVAHLAGLARIDLSDAELDRLAGELPAILQHVAAVQDAAGPQIRPMSHPQPIVNVFREDIVVPGLTPDDALAGAPASEDQRFLVPRILGED
ncbi:aspartyl/glutamyl-tRNA(Asn/Gln) amidotransferase, C subunit [Aeromicrobium marinum DSM 15272]|uniref:Aspartyl/glutamyl-tRNA(Asn/Gln) amidotransferase subunit C n=1 Tax=Aeromicrobium marinum DSM 15272 TaxID=585531 RepID=E2SCZ1_9ACTN|nr:Asp-tRNA(Asn)/Glu-tRNA(Gln) amidotransferase subunit GatC [Aeromicrobium marinum]EFQ83094.1 aspartyl/glutamyl-tRNA(Asn/Gln) amidotransferase, C subunit [Aeromicrobium marinum DSM 15272]